MTTVCIWCENDIEWSNRRWPGYCSAECRDNHRVYRTKKQPNDDEGDER